MSVTLNLNTIRQRASAFSKAFEGVTSEKERDQDFMRDFCKIFGINPNRIDWQDGDAVTFNYRDFGFL